VKAIDGAVGKIHIIDQSKCTKCGTCFEVCRFNAVQKISGQPVPAPIPEAQRLKKPTKKEN
jgi:NADH-quinone oxidoreductase subunit F